MTTGMVCVILSRLFLRVLLPGCDVTDVYPTISFTQPFCLLIGALFPEIFTIFQGICYYGTFNVFSEVEYYLHLVYLGPMFMGPP